MLKPEKGETREGGEKRVCRVYSVYLVGRDKKDETDHQVTNE
jgi:hypothetical protein